MANLRPCSLDRTRFLKLYHSPFSHISHISMDPRNTPFTHSADLWLADGNVVLQIEETAFRVYTGILSRHSVFFKNLFTLPQPPEAEMYEGCPLVILQDDKPEEVRYFLLSLFDIEYESHFSSISSYLPSKTILFTDTPYRCCNMQTLSLRCLN